MELTEIISQLERNTGTFPREALENAIAEQATITPVLIETLKKCKDNLNNLLEDPDYILHLYALYLLAQFREKSAYPVIIDFFSVPGEDAMDVTGDVVTEDLGRIIASVFDGNLNPIKQLIENQQASDYIRGAALESLIILVVNEIITRKQVIEYFEELFSVKLERKAEYIFNKLVLNASELCPIELKQHIDKAFEEDLIDEMFIVQEEVDEFLEEGVEAAIEKLRNHHHTLIDNAVSEMQSWACFGEGNFQSNYSRFPAPSGFAKVSHSQKAQASKKKKMQKQSRRKNRKNKK
ncbi:MAG: DUF1186 family protein [Calothrix sp. FI2-JRJ7]|jgi:hypothetical protein|nr:DUF1186 family protein [Calothrix sp. FI2-JRJ7]